MNQKELIEAFMMISNWKKETFGLVVYTLFPYPAKFIYLNFHSLEVVSRYRDPQLQALIRDRPKIVANLNV